MNYRYKLQESLNDNDENYTLKTNRELKNMIIDFGCGETEFHTGDIERLIKEHEKMHEVLKAVNNLFETGFQSDYDTEQIVSVMKKAIELYVP